MPTKILIVGCGGHAKVVIDAVKTSSLQTEIVVADEDIEKIGQKIFGEISVVAVDSWLNHPEQTHIAIGNNNDRASLYMEAKSSGKQLITIVHPASYLATGVEIGKASFIAANAIVSSDTNIGIGCIVNHAVVIDHDCEVGDFCHIAPNVTLGGGVKIGKKCLIGSGAIVLPQITIGDNTVIGAGAVVTKDVSTDQTVFGVPARPVGKNEEIR